MTLLDKLKALYAIKDRLESWLGTLIDSMWAQTGSGTDDALLSAGQAETLRDLYAAYFIGEQK